MSESCLLCLLCLQRRKLRPDNNVAASLKFPRVPPNSFVSSQPQPWSATSSIQSTFSTADLIRALEIMEEEKLTERAEKLGNAVGLAWLGQACVTDAQVSSTSSGNETV
ncbi:Anaphase-promoting complex subunit 1 [Ciborinia camelliae]|nr:Anaphase-promoting complex subunit 1 [Ciborinia camelliae]